MSKLAKNIGTTAAFVALIVGLTAINTLIVSVAAPEARAASRADAQAVDASAASPKRVRCGLDDMWVRDPVDRRHNYRMVGYRSCEQTDNFGNGPWWVIQGAALRTVGKAKKIPRPYRFSFPKRAGSSKSWTCRFRQDLDPADRWAGLYRCSSTAGRVYLEFWWHQEG